MKFPPIYAALICAGLMAAPTQLSGQPAPPAATNALGPRLTFVTNQYHYGRVIKGTLVKYVFIASNAGDQTLEISKVTPGCHCTTAGDWSKAHKIEPGKTAEIPIQFDTGAFSGDLTRNITVTSNDKLAPVQQLTLQGTIWNPIEVTPQFANFNIMPDAPSNATTVVHITSHFDEPVTLSNPTSANGSFKAELKTITPGKEFEVTVTAVPPFPSANTTGTISIKTSSINMPVLNITARATVQPAIGLTPAQITLPPQMDRPTTNLVTITARGRKALALSDPMASDERVGVTIKEINPGRVFQLAAVFPPGFRIVPGRQALVKIKSDNAERPVIVVPIYQAQPPPAHLNAMDKNLPPPPPLPATGHP
jgi:hypothetical protein